ncbi:MAG: choice-of-anchor D domain-containing protein, partial [Candidatus Caldarchaeum sp.]
MNADEAQAVQLASGQQLLIPFGEDAHLVWTRTNGQTAAVGLIRQGNKTLNVSADGQERVVRFLPVQKVEKLVRKLREKSKFQEFEGKLAQKGKRVGKIRALFDETNKIAILGIASEGDEEKIVHQVRIKVKPDKDDEPEENAEPAIQATACGQATGEAVPTGAKMQPLTAPPGEWDIVEGGYEGPELCTSQWGYDYLCISRTPAISLSTTSLTLPQTFINQQTQASFIIWNSGGGTLSGTVSVPAPFSIASGASFSLLPGQPQEVVVRFSSATPGSFSKSIGISSNGGSATVTATAIAHKVSFSPAQLDFGSGLLVLREQCNKMGTCGLGTEKVGLPIERQLTVKNEGTVAVTLALSTAAPYKIVSVLPTLSPGQSGQVTVRFDPNESGSFTGAVQVGINGGQGSVTSSPLIGVAHKIEIDPAELNFGIAIVGTTKEQKLTVKNQGVTTVTIDVPNTTQNMTSPFRVVLESPLLLGPGESKEVPVQFSPTESGQFTGTVKLLISQAFLEVLAKAKAYTEEEIWAWYEQQREADAEICSAIESTLGTTPPIYIPRGDLDAILYGFSCLNREQFREFIRFLMSGGWENITPSSLDVNLDSWPWPAGFWDSAQFLAALQTLLNSQNFENTFQQLYLTNPSFATFVETMNVWGYDSLFSMVQPGKSAVMHLVSLLQAHPELLGTIDQLLQGLTSFIRSGNVNAPIPVIDINTWIAKEHIVALYAIARMQAASQAGAYQQAGLTPILVANYVSAMARAIGAGGIAAYSAYLSSYLLTSLADRFLHPTEGIANVVGQVITIGILVSNGWTVKWSALMNEVVIELLFRSRKGFEALDLVATTTINDRKIAAFIHVEARLVGEEVDRIANTLLA